MSNNEVFKNPFLRDYHDYDRHINPLEDYIVQATKYISKQLDVDLLTADKLVRKALKESNIKDPKVKAYERGENGDKEEINTSLLTYLNLVNKNKEIIAPSLTAYLNTSKLDSFQKKFILGNLNKRKVAKKKMADFKAVGDTDNFIYYNVLQKVLKIFNNSLSGAYAITSTPLYNPSAHYSLTSTTRSVASIGNAVSEMLISGNRYYKDVYNVINSITATITHVDLKLIEDVVRKFNITIPTVDDVMSMVLRSSRLYFKSISKEKEIYDYILKLTDIERTAFLYVNDLYQLRLHNDKFIRGLLSGLSNKLSGYYYDNDYSVLETSDDFVINLMFHICSDEVRGMKVDFKKMRATKAMDTMVSTTKNINAVLYKAKDFIKAFFGTDILPIDISDVKDMLRRAIVLSDTDSTCATYNDWVVWFFGTDLQSTRATALTAGVMTINTQVIDHFLKAMSANMGVESDSKDMLAMKNEFYWPTMVPANVAKHYYAGVGIQEGSVFKELERELKGVHLHANNIPPYFKNKAMDMIDNIQSTLVNNKKIDLYEYVKFVADLEIEILDTLHSLDPKVLKNGKIKEAKAYTDGPTKSKYRYHTLWSEVFSPVYGEIIEPPYTTYELPVVLKNKTNIKNMMDNPSGDVELVKRLGEFVTRSFASGLMTLQLPKSKIDGCKIPKEVLSIIDFNRSVEIIMNPFYIILDTIGFCRKPSLLVCEQMCMK